MSADRDAQLAGLQALEQSFRPDDRPSTYHQRRDLPRTALTYPRRPYAERPQAQISARSATRATPPTLAPPRQLAEPQLAEPYRPGNARHSRRAGRGASVLLSRGQKVILLTILVAVAAGFYYRPEPTAILLVATCTAGYVITGFLKLFIFMAGRSYSPPSYVRVSPDDPTLPMYAVLLPVHKEANVLHLLVARVNRLIYPGAKLRVFLLIEHDDYETIEAAQRLGIPLYGDRRRSPARIRVLIVPPGGPKTKPNALNAAIPVILREQCQFLTIYDAEDWPDPHQLLKAVGTFRRSSSDLACLQAELVFWNDNVNWITALYWIAYKVHFTRYLPGLARLRMPIPLGGTSNHFRVSALLNIATQRGRLVWDPYNLTEDADLGARLAAAGYRVELLRSRTMEEAPIRARVVDKQQRRWKAGYLQTGLVHVRHPLRSMRQMGPIGWLSFNAIMLGVPFVFLLNPIFLAITVAYFATRAEPVAALFPTAIYYPSIALMVAGNLGVLYELAHTFLAEAHASRGRFGQAKYILLAPLMWLWNSCSTYLAVLELISGRRGWHKTPHGDSEASADMFPASPPSYRGNGASRGQALHRLRDF